MLKAGAGCAEIKLTEDLFPIEGFRGVHDLPHIRVLLLEQKKRAVLAAVELVNVTGDGLREIKNQIALATGVPDEDIFVHITHAITTPHIPDDPDQVQKGPKNEHMDEISASDARRQRGLFLTALRSAAKEAAKAAATSLCPTKVSCGTGNSLVNVNRDIDTPFGTWINLNPKGFSNKEIRLLRFEDASGKLICLLVNYDLKPCAIDNSQREIGERLVSSDIPGCVCSAYEKKFGGVCLYTMAAAGDQVPREMAILENIKSDGTVSVEDYGIRAGFEIVERLGNELFEDIIAAEERLVRQETEGEMLTLRTKMTCGKKKRMNFAPRLSAEFIPDGTMELDTSFLCIGDIAFVMTRPEINSVTGHALKAHSPFERTFLLSMTDGDLKYMPDLVSYQKVSWESQSSILMPGTAEQWLDHSLASLSSMKKSTM